MSNLLAPELLADLGLNNQWQIQALDGASGTLSQAGQDLSRADQDVVVAKVSGPGRLVIRPPAPLTLPAGTGSIQLWIHCAQVPPAQLRLALLFDETAEGPVEPFDFSGWHMLRHLVTPNSVRQLSGLIVEGLDEGAEVELGLSGLIAAPPPAPHLEPAHLPGAQDHPAQLELGPYAEEMTHIVEKEGISFIFEARSLSAVIRYVYTPIDGTFEDIDLEINNAEPIKPASGGGLTIAMGGQTWAADDDEVERHFVSCDQVGDSVEARWQWKRDEELADFLFRFRLQGKTLVVELEAGNDRAAGVDLGILDEIPHPRLISLPYFNLGQQPIQLLEHSGVFVSSLLDWYSTKASSLYGAAGPDRLNGGCHYEPDSNGRRQLLGERWLLTASRQIDEVLPAPPQLTPLPRPEGLEQAIWYAIPPLEKAEETYVELYEQLRGFKLMGVEHLLVHHPADIWDSGTSDTSLTLEPARELGGGDALAEYLEAVQDLGFPYILATSFAALSPLNPQWNPEWISLNSRGELAPATPGSYRLKPTQAAQLAAGHATALAEKYPGATLLLRDLADQPPWQRTDCDSRLDQAAMVSQVIAADQALLANMAELPAALLVNGGTHWLYAGRAHGFYAQRCDAQASQAPLVVDFALRFMHPFHIDAGLGSPESYFGEALTDDEKNSRSTFFDRYLAATVAFGHAGRLFDPGSWGMPAALKSYFMLQKLQPYYLGVPVQSIHYHHNDHLVESNEALISDAIAQRQLQIVYENGLHILVNDHAEDSWTVQHDDQDYLLPPGSFLAYGPNNLLVYSADAGQGRIDYALCPDFMYCDLRATGQPRQMGPVTQDGAVLVRHREWEIDVYPIECGPEIAVHTDYLWPDRRMPRLRVLAFRPDEDTPELLKTESTPEGVEFTQVEGAYMYRITLPEWMVEPGR
ncbi:MAG: hypothetical protein GKR89_09155 [Candidatus Latescibacteria bacterium]|nr:hypothetical protein [Candidatus Latescibacterota bacterium]